jgi:hypothetical protein
MLLNPIIYIFYFLFPTYMPFIITEPYFSWAGGSCVGRSYAEVIHNRSIAATAYKIGLAEGPLAALKYFRNNKKGSFGDGNEAKLIKWWGQRFETTGSVSDANECRTGRKPKVPEAAVIECAKALLAGYTVKGEHGVKVRRGFTSLKAAVESDKAPKLKKAVQQYGITIPSLHRRMRKVVPSLAHAKRRIDIKSVLDPAVKKQRKLGAAILRRLPMKQLRAVVWMDAKKLHVSGAGKLSVYTDDPDEVVEDARLPQGKFSSGHVLHYYAAVNAILGVVTFVWVTGTTGLNTGYTTTVCPGIAPASFALTRRVTHRILMYAWYSVHALLK